MQKAGERETRKHLVIAKPFALEDDKDSENAASNGIRRILSLFKNVRLGSDLTNFQVKKKLVEINESKFTFYCVLYHRSTIILRFYFLED